jgi:glycosyltransferase involved in cell wall biosynthesis
VTRVSIVDPSAYTPPYDHALCAALARAGADVELVTSRFAYGEVPSPDGYAVRELFYRRARGAPGSRARRLAKLATHAGDMRALRRTAGDVVHFQWIAMPWLDVHLLPDRPLVLTAHDLLPREPRPGQARAQRRIFDRVDALIAHSEHGRRQIVERLRVPAGKVHVIHHGAFMPGSAGALPSELCDTGRPVVLLLGLLRPYKGIDTLLRAWRGIEGAQLWIVGRPMMELPPAPAGVSLVPRFVTDGEAAALVRRADVMVLPYSGTDRFDQSGVLADALGAGRATVLSDIGGFSEVAAIGAARLVAPGDPVALHDALAELIADPGARDALGAAALVAARGPYSWDAAARTTLALYASLTR